MTSTHADEYLLGHDAVELDRLERQAAILAPATATLLTMAGVRPGMRVLDIGTGAGDVAFLAAEIVGALVPSSGSTGHQRHAAARARAEPEVLPT